MRPVRRGASHGRQFAPLVPAALALVGRRGGYGRQIGAQVSCLRPFSEVALPLQNSDIVAGAMGTDEFAGFLLGHGLSIFAFPGMPGEVAGKSNTAILWIAGSCAVNG